MRLEVLGGVEKAEKEGWWRRRLGWQGEGGRVGMWASEEMAVEEGEERVEVVRGRERDGYGGMGIGDGWCSSWYSSCTVWCDRVAVSGGRWEVIVIGGEVRVVVEDDVEAMCGWRPSRGWTEAADLVDSDDGGREARGRRCICGIGCLFAADKDRSVATRAIGVVGRLSSGPDDSESVSHSCISRLSVYSSDLPKKHTVELAIVGEKICDLVLFAPSMERVQFEQEGMVLELKVLVDNGSFTQVILFLSFFISAHLPQQETKQIMRKRTAFECALVRRVAKKADFLRYIAFESGLEALARKRTQRLS